MLNVGGQADAAVKKKTSLKYYVIKQINICLSVAGCFVHSELFNVGMWENDNAERFTLVNVCSGACGMFIVFPKTVTTRNMRGIFWIHLTSVSTEVPVERSAKRKLDDR